jgi:hypothetical protein
LLLFLGRAAGLFEKGENPADMIPDTPENQEVPVFPLPSSNLFFLIFVFSLLLGAQVLADGADARTGDAAWEGGQGDAVLALQGIWPSHG